MAFSNLTIEAIVSIINLYVQRFFHSVDCSNQQL